MDWKSANVVPIYKKGDKSKVGKYWPILLTLAIGKLLESILTKHIANHLETNKLIIDSQYGFRSRRSCLSNLLEFFHEMLLYHDNCRAVDIIYLNFQKAFDTVPHKRLMVKVRALDIMENFGGWIENWFKNRRQRVLINGESSESVDVNMFKATSIHYIYIYI